MKTTWDFVEKYYPKYYSSDEIALSNDLEVFLNEEHDDNDTVFLERIANALVDYVDKKTFMLKSKLFTEFAQRVKGELIKNIYEKAIENFIKTN